MKIKELNEGDVIRYLTCNTRHTVIRIKDDYNIRLSNTSCPCFTLSYLKDNYEHISSQVGVYDIY